MAQHSLDDCPKEHCIPRTNTVGGEKQHIVFHPCCPDCGQYIGRKRWGDSVFEVVDFGDGMVEAQAVSHVEASCAKCGAVKLEATYAE